MLFSSVPRVRKLLKSGVSVNASDGAPSDNKALHWAVSYGNENIVKFLCGKHFEPTYNLRCIQFWTSFFRMDMF